MHWAQDLGIPIIIHSREATDEIIEILTENTFYTEGGILHCFTGNVEQAKTLIDLGFYLGIGGVSTGADGGAAGGRAGKMSDPGAGAASMTGVSGSAFGLDFTGMKWFRRGEYMSE